MRLQLVFFSLFLLLLYLDCLLAEVFGGGKPRGGFYSGQGGAGGLAEKANAAFRDALWSYVPFAAVAVMMFSFGKPELFPQWAGWGVVGSQVLRTIALVFDWRAAKFCFGLLVVVGLAYLWVNQLPFFDPAPY